MVISNLKGSSYGNIASLTGSRVVSRQHGAGLTVLRASVAQKAPGTAIDNCVLAICEVVVLDAQPPILRAKLSVCKMAPVYIARVYFCGQRPGRPEAVTDAANLARRGRPDGLEL